MSNDLKEIKKKIYDDGKIEELLSKMNCDYIKTEQNGELITAQLPYGSNRRSVQVKNNEYLSSSIRSRGVHGDVFHLVSYIIHGIENEEDQKQDLFDAKKWICEQLGYEEFLNPSYKPIEKTDYNSWLKKVKKQRNNQSVNALDDNKIIKKSVMNQFVCYPHIKWVKDGLSIATQKAFEVSYDIQSNRIVFPVHNRNGELIGIKGRRIEKRHDDDPKYIYLYPCNKSIELYNLHRALPYIQESKEVIVFEGAKSCMRAYEYGVFNVVSIEGSEISHQQVKKIKDLGMDIRVIFMLDKDKDKKSIKQQATKVTNRDVCALWDKNNLLGRPEDKHSPVDLGKETFERLYQNNIYKIT